MFREMGQPTLRKFLPSNLSALKVEAYRYEVLLWQVIWSGVFLRIKFQTSFYIQENTIKRLYADQFMSVCRADENMLFVLAFCVFLCSFEG